MRDCQELSVQVAEPPIGLSRSPGMLYEQVHGTSYSRDQEMTGR